MIALPSLREAGLTAKAASASQANFQDIEARNNNAFAAILGEARASAADFMFVKTERYLHSGIAFAPHEDAGVTAKNTEFVSAEEMAGNGPELPNHEGHEHNDAHSHRSAHVHDENCEHEHEAHEPEDHDHEAHDHEGHDHEGHDHAEAATLIRTEATDFRGFLGNLEREVKPWQDPSAQHELASGAELLPWYRLITLSNPHFVRAYRVGAMWLSFEGHEEQALEFLNEGIEKNPDNPELYQLYLSKAQVQMRLARIGDETSMFEQALATVKTGLAAGLGARPEGGIAGVVKNGLMWTEDHEEDFVFLARFVPILLERMRRFDDALAEARRGSQLAPEDAILAKMAARLERGESAYIVGPPRF